MENLIEKLQDDLAGMKALVVYYDGMKAQAEGKGLFVYVINEVRAMKFDGQVATMGSYSQAAVFSENVIQQIEKNAVFKNSRGEQITPIGRQPAEQFFSDQVDNVNETIRVVENAIVELNKKQK